MLTSMPHAEFSLVIFKDARPEELDWFNLRLQNLMCKHEYNWDGHYLVKIHEELAIWHSWRPYVFGEQPCPTNLILEFKSNSLAYPELCKVDVYTNRGFGVLLHCAIERLSSLGSKYVNDCLLG